MSCVTKKGVRVRAAAFGQMVRGRVRWGSDQGSATVFVLGLAVVLMALAGMIIDGGTAINARQTLADDVEQAGRAGSTALLLGAGPGGTTVLDRGLAQQRARDYLVRLGYQSSDISFPPDMPQAGVEISVSASRVVPTKVLQVIGIENFPISAAITSRAATGITAEVKP